MDGEGEGEIDDREWAGKLFSSNVLRANAVHALSTTSTRLEHGGEVGGVEYCTLSCRGMAIGFVLAFPPCNPPI